MTKQQKDFVSKSGVRIEASVKDAYYQDIFPIGAVRTESKDWKPFRPTFENQGSTYDCTNFSANNVTESKMKEAGVADEDGNEINLSDLELAVRSGTTTNGNNMTAGPDILQKQGIVLERYCSYDGDMLDNPTSTWSRRQQKVNAIPVNARRYKGGAYSFINPKRKDAMMDALEFSPLRIAIGLNQTWFNNGVVPKCKNSTAYHACVVEKIYPNGQYRVFDSVNKNEVTLAADYELLQVQSFRDFDVEGWKVQRDKYIESIREVFGPMWKPANIFYRRGLIQRGIYGAVRVGGSSTVPPYRVFLIGPGGRPVASQEDFVQLFATKFQDNIVGIVSPEEGRLLGIGEIEIQNAIPINIKSSTFINLWRQLTW